jgi:hypothetical protein
VSVLVSSHTRRDDRLRLVAAVWEREGHSPGEALFRARTCLLIAGPPVPWADRVAAIRKRRKETK